MDLVELVSQTAADFATSTTSVEVCGDADELVVFADPNRLRQVFENLLSNAFKVQPPQVSVEISLAVHDAWASSRSPITGQAFQQRSARASSSCSAPARRGLGLGVGLYLVRGISEAHGGSVEVESVPVTERASSFGSRLRVSPSSPAWCPRTDAPRPQPRISGRHVPCL